MTGLVPEEDTLEFVAKRLGSIPLNRIRVRPPIGTATLDDLIVANTAKPLCELIDGTLVEKASAFPESVLTASLGAQVSNATRDGKQGVVSGPGGTLRFGPRLILAPDIAFVPWSRIPDHKLLKEFAPELVPTLAVEVLTDGNTVPEMARRRAIYFEAGVRLVWIVSRSMRTVDVFTRVDQCHTLTIDDTLTAGDVLPDFRQPLRDLFRLWR